MVNQTLQHLQLNWIELKHMNLTLGIFKERFVSFLYIRQIFKLYLLQPTRLG